MSHYTDLFFIGFIIILPILFFVFQQKTKFKKTIKIKSKYIEPTSKNSSYMILTNNNEIFKIENSLFWSAFDRAERWNSIESDHDYEVEGYGIRYPLLNMYPSIIFIDEI